MLCVLVRFTNPHKPPETVHHICLIFIFLISISTAIRPQLNGINLSERTSTITLLPVLAHTGVLAHLCSGQQCLGQRLWSSLLQPLYLSLRPVTFPPGSLSPLFPSSGSQERLMDGACL